MSRNNVFLTSDQLEGVRKILQQHIPENEVLVFGSRATGRNLKNHSDLDLLIKTHSPLSIRKLRELSDAFEESNLPFSVDLVESINLSESFKSKIILEAIAIVRAKSNPAKVAL